MGRETLFAYFGLKKYYLFSDQINKHAYLCLLISIIGIIIGISITHLKIGIESKKNVKDVYVQNSSLRRVSKYFYYVCLIPQSIELFFKIMVLEYK